MTSTVGAGAADPRALAAVVEEPDFELHEVQAQMLPARARPHRTLRLI